MAFNYHDEMTKGGTQDWISYLNQHYLETHAAKISVFKLDKQETNIDELYGGELYGGARIYKPPFEIRAFYLDNEWTQQLGADTFPYLETQDDITFAVNFENMVHKIRELKSKTKTEIFVEFTGSKEVTAEKINDILIFKVNDEEVANFDLTENDYRIISKLVISINSLNGFKCSFEGENDKSTNLVSFRETRFQNKKLRMFSEDDTFKNMTDIIESGDLILTEKYFLYEVHNNLPGGNMGWEYSMMLLTGNARSLDKVELPNNWNELIREREYGLRHKIKME